MSERWAMLLVIFFTRTSLGFQFQSIAALTPFLVTAFDISWAQVGLLMGLFMLPGVVFALPGGLLGQRFGSQRVVFAGLGLMITGGMLVSYAGGFGSAAFGRTLAGIGGVLVNIMLARMVADWFRGRELQTSLGLMLAAWPFGMALALMMLGPLALIASWRVAEYATVVAAALALGGDGAHLPGPAGGGRRRGGAAAAQRAAPRVGAGDQRGRRLGAAQREHHRGGELRAELSHVARGLGEPRGPDHRRRALDQHRVGAAGRPGGRPGEPAEAADRHRLPAWPPPA